MGPAPSFFCANEANGAVAHGGYGLSCCVRPRDNISQSLLKSHEDAVTASVEEAIDVLDHRLGFHLVQRPRVLEGCDVSRLLEPFVVLTRSTESTSIDGYLPAFDSHYRHTLQLASLNVQKGSVIAPRSCRVRRASAR